MIEIMSSLHQKQRIIVPPPLYASDGNCTKGAAKKKDHFKFLRD